VATGGDIDQGGGADLLVGAPRFAGAGLAAGRIYVYHGESAALLGTLDGATGDNLGISVGVRGDLDGDGFAEIVAGALYADASSGTDAGAVLRIDLGVGQFTDLGFAKSGSAGIPRLEGSGSLVEGLPTAWRLSSVVPGAAVILVVGLAHPEIPLFGGTLVPSPDLLLPFVADAGGVLELAFPWPSGIGPTTPLYAQAWIEDAAASFGLSASNGLSSVAAP
jgi:hypothetical protein